MRIGDFSYSFLMPLLGFAMSFLVAFLGLRCTIRARACRGWGRTWWLLFAGVSLGLAAWFGQFIDMAGFAAPGEIVRYSVPGTLASALITVAVMWVGLFVSDYSGRGRRLVPGGLLVGLGIASMHYTGMEATRLPGPVSYDPAWLLVSSAVAIAGGIAALWSIRRLQGIWPTIGASLITAAAIGGMHYAGIASMRMTGQPAAMAVAGATAGEFLLPAVVVIGTLIFLMAFAVALAPTEYEIREDAALQALIADLERQSSERVTVLAVDWPALDPMHREAHNPLRTPARRLRRVTRSRRARSRSWFGRLALGKPA